MCGFLLICVQVRPHQIFNRNVNFSLFWKGLLENRGNLVLVDPALFRLLIHNDKRLFHLVVQGQKTQREKEEQLCHFLCIVQWKQVEFSLSQMNHFHEPAQSLWGTHTAGAWENTLQFRWYLQLGCVFQQMHWIVRDCRWELSEGSCPSCNSSECTII